MMLRSFFTVALLLLAAAPAWAGSNCTYGSWRVEAQKAVAAGWRLIELTPAERALIVKTYEHQSHEKLAAAHAWEEKQWHFGAATQYSIVFTDAAGCIQFRLGFATPAELLAMLSPGI